jgi:hypothetical protein
VGLILLTSGVRGYLMGSPLVHRGVHVAADVLKTAKDCDEHGCDYDARVAFRTTSGRLITATVLDVSSGAFGRLADGTIGTLEVVYDPLHPSNVESADNFSPMFILVLLYGFVPVGGILTMIGAILVLPGVGRALDARRQRSPRVKRLNQLPPWGSDPLQGQPLWKGSYLVPHDPRSVVIARFKDALKRNVGRVACRESELPCPAQEIRQALIAEDQSLTGLRSLSIHSRRFLEDALVELECFVPDVDAALVEAWQKSEQHLSDSALSLSDEDIQRAEAVLKDIRHRQGQALAWLRGETSPDATDEVILEREPVLVGSAHKSITRVLLHGELVAAQVLALLIWIPLWLARAVMETEGFPSKRESLHTWVLGAGAFAAAPLLAIVWVRLSDAPLGFLREPTRTTVKLLGGSLLLLGIGIYLGWGPIATKWLDVLTRLFIGILALATVAGLVNITARPLLDRRRQQGVSVAAR